eukprot:TRINITY_DN26789_c0_g1_i3.p1 TRINITY_DN26789_c0_g1~~TRINITY_DN26789_c0_g1_i3.p1  ORF type:complete len:348 (-),score=3.17 TRINITY_DN26789_c0_g1_i3:363-1406(-)
MAAPVALLLALVATAASSVAADNATAAAAVTHVAAVESNRVLFPTFADTTMLQLFGAAQPIPTTGALRLTSKPSSAGGFVLRTPMLLLDKKSANSTACKPLAWKSVFQFKSSGLADGLAFVIWSKKRNLGSANGYLGYGGAVRYKKSRSLAVEFDMMKNSWDPSPTHVGINVRSSVKSVAVKVLNRPMNDSVVRRAWIIYDGQSLSVYIGKGKRQPPAPALRYALNTCSVLKQPGYYVGFTGSSAGTRSTQDILSWSFSVAQSNALCPKCGSTLNLKKQVSCCMPFQCCNGVCLAPTELCGGSTCCGSPANGRVCWGVKCCSVTSLCMSKSKKPVCCPQIGNSTCCL